MNGDFGIENVVTFDVTDNEIYNVDILYCLNSKLTVRTFFVLAVIFLQKEVKQPTEGCKTVAFLVK